MASALSQAEVETEVEPERELDGQMCVVSIHRRMAAVYRQLGARFSAAASLIRAGEMALALMQKRGQSRQVLNQELLDNCNGADVDALWDLFQALLLAMETGDFVRMQSTMCLLEQCDNWTLYQDVEVIYHVENMEEFLLC
jgi:hypothetical protein